MTTVGAHVEALHIAPEGGADMQPVDEVEAVAGKGLRGDRYFEGTGTYSPGGELEDIARDIPRHLTLFEAEALEVVARDHDIELDPADHRRNVTTRNLAVDHLLDERFRVGNAVCEGIEVCEPCAHLESLTEDGVVRAFTHRAGLNATIVESGTVEVGDPVEVVE
jgi:MOSC domain-containing protein YiiM